MTRRISYLACAVAAVAALAPAGAAAAPPAPTIEFFTPRTAKIGDTVTVSGRNYLPGRGRTTLVFLSSGGPAVFVKADSATSRRLKVRLPARLLSHFDVAESGELKRTVFQLRVVARRAGERFTPRRISLAVLPPANSTAPGTPGPGPDQGLPQPEPKPADCDGDGITDDNDPNDDTDLLDDQFERGLGTQVCSSDSDADGIEDGWEYHSAKDLNVKAVPYPAKRPYPNPLDASDRNIDFDGDGLTMIDEFRAWIFTNKRFDPARANAAPRRESPLFYSDGTQTSRPGFPASEAGETPAFNRFQFQPDSAIYGGNLYPSAYPQPDYADSRTCPRPAPEPRCGFLDDNADGEFSDNERDADNDGLDNFDETHGNMRISTWNARLRVQCDPAVKPWRDIKEGVYYGEFDLRPFGEPAVDDPDSDGDSLLDGEDDQDNDDVPNYSELLFNCADDTPGGNVHPYNPCAPYDSGRAPAELQRKSCPKFKPLS